MFQPHQQFDATNPAGVPRPPQRTSKVARLLQVELEAARNLLSSHRGDLELLEKQLRGRRPALSRSDFGPRFGTVGSELIVVLDELYTTLEQRLSLNLETVYQAHQLLQAVEDTDQGNAAAFGRL